MKKFTEWMEEHTLLAHYRVENPRLLQQISNMDGTEVDVDDDEQGGTVTIDSITHQKTALELKKMAAAGQIRSVAGEVTRDMTGKARPVGTQYMNPGIKEWSRKDDIWSMVHNFYPVLAPRIEKVIEDFKKEHAGPELPEQDTNIAISQVLINITKKYDPLQ